MASVDAGLSLVVCPLVSLMANQVDVLKTKHGVVAACLSSKTLAAEKRFVTDQLAAGCPLLRVLYVTPEQLVSNKGLVDTLRKLGQTGRLALMAIDEAHCVLQWGARCLRARSRRAGDEAPSAGFAVGTVSRDPSCRPLLFSGHDFRRDYEKLGSVREAIEGGASRLPLMVRASCPSICRNLPVQHCSHSCSCHAATLSLSARPLRQALTATVTHKGVEEIRSKLGMRSPVIVAAGFNRPNISYSVLYIDVVGREFVQLTDLLVRPSAGR